MPVTTQVWGLVRDDHEMEGPFGDDALTTRTQIVLPRLIGLDGSDRHLGMTAHTSSPITTATATTTMTMSKVVLSCLRNGLKPTPRR